MWYMFKEFKLGSFALPVQVAVVDNARPNFGAKLAFVVCPDFAEGRLCLKRMMVEHAGDLNAVLSQPCWPSSAPRNPVPLWVGRNGSGH